MNGKILQIVPADGWDATFDDGRGSRVPLVAWALVRTLDGATKIKGVIPASYHQMQFCEDMESFLCFVPRGVEVPGHTTETTSLETLENQGGRSTPAA